MRWAAMLCVSVLLGGCGADEASTPRAAGAWDVDRNPRDDNCGLMVRDTARWTIDEDLLLDITLQKLPGEADGASAVFRFEDEGESGGCSYSGDITVEITLSEDDQSFTGDLRGYLRYDPANRCGAAALAGPIRCEMDVGVTGRRVVE